MGIYIEIESQFGSIDGNHSPGSHYKMASFGSKATEKTFTISSAVSSCKNTLKSTWRNQNFFSVNLQNVLFLVDYNNFYLYYFCTESQHAADFFFCLDMFRYCTLLSCYYLFSQDAQHFMLSFYYLLQ